MEIKTGNIYYLPSTSGSRDNQYYIEVAEDRNRCNNIYMNRKYIYNKHTGNFKRELEILDSLGAREATSAEVEWFKECMKTGEYTDPPKEEVINSYSIF